MQHELVLAIVQFLVAVVTLGFAVRIDTRIQVSQNNTVHIVQRLGGRDVNIQDTPDTEGGK